MRKTVFLLASLFVMMLATQRVNAQNPSATANATAVWFFSIREAIIRQLLLQPPVRPRRPILYHFLQVQLLQGRGTLRR